MFVKNNIAQPGEIRAVFLDPLSVEVKLRSGEVIRYERKDFVLRVNDPKRGNDEKDKTLALETRPVSQ